MNMSCYRAAVPGGQGGLNAGQYRVCRKANGRAMVVPRPGAASARPGRWRRRGRGCPGDGSDGVYVGAAVQLCCRGGSPPVVSPSGMSCAWPTVLTAQTDNTAFPDAAEAIFGQLIVASADTRIVLSGRFPDARYASVQVYTPGGVGASLPDYQIAPQPGSLNPWQQQARPAAGSR